MSVLLSLVAASAALSAPTGDKLLTLEQTSRRPDAEAVSLRPDLPRWRWAWDGEHLVRVGDGEEEKDAWFDPRTGKEVPAKTRPEDEGLAKRALALQKEIDGVGRRPDLGHAGGAPGEGATPEAGLMGIP